jgi:hypothetical protein
MIEQALGSGSKFGMRIIYSHEPVILGTGGGIKQAEPHFSGEPVLILNGDTLVELDLEALCDFHRTRGAAATRQLAKRQLTWLRAMGPEVERHDCLRPDLAEAVEARVARFLQDSDRL